MRILTRLTLLGLGLSLLAAGAAPLQAAHHEKDHDKKQAEGEWVSLFNGENLDGWTPKIAGHALGEDPKNTFRVEDGKLVVSYDNYEQFNGRFGHLFYDTPYSHYKIRAEYRFVGQQVEGGPGWAFRNNGLMLHGQAPETMGKNQNFPTCIEVQLLGGRESGERPTANLCTPNTHVRIDGELTKKHCIKSNSKTYRGDQWVTVTIEVHGSDMVRHFVNGNEVMRYTDIQLNDGTPRGEGTISIQAESHPIEYRSIKVKKLDKNAAIAPEPAPDQTRVARDGACCGAAAK
jgi:hypothetical protein